MINQTIAHYKITSKLGQGGMGEVYRATVYLIKGQWDHCTKAEYTRKASLERQQWDRLG